MVDHQAIAKAEKMAQKIDKKKLSLDTLQRKTDKASAPNKGLLR